MTAPEPTRPTAEHIDAVALVIESAWSDGDEAKIAHRILTSTDPAVHLAMLDALVRAGVLTRHVWGPTFGGGYQSHFQTTPEPATQDDALAHLRERMSREVAP